MFSSLSVHVHTHMQACKHVTSFPPSRQNKANRPRKASFSRHQIYNPICNSRLIPSASVPSHYSSGHTLHLSYSSPIPRTFSRTSGYLLFFFFTSGSFHFFLLYPSHHHSNIRNSLSYEKEITILDSTSLLTEAVFSPSFTKP